MIDLQDPLAQDLVNLVQQPFDAHRSEDTWIGQQGIYVVKISSQDQIKIEHNGRLWLFGVLEPVKDFADEDAFLERGYQRLQNAFSLPSLQAYAALYQRLQLHALKGDPSESFHAFFRTPQGFACNTADALFVPPQRGCFLETMAAGFLRCSWKEVSVVLPASAHERLQLLHALEASL